MSKPEFEVAIQRLMFQAEVGGWYKEDSTVPVRIGDLYSTFDELKRLREELKKTKEFADYWCYRFSEKANTPVRVIEPY